MAGLEALRGRKILLATEDSFTGNYISAGLRYLGVETVGPIKSVTELLRLAETQEQPTLACISINLPGVDATLEQALKQHAVPYVLFGFPMSGTAWTTAAVLWPFSAFQIAEELLALPAQPAK